METQKHSLLNEIDRLSRGILLCDHLNAVLGIFTDLDEFSDCYVITENLAKILVQGTITIKRVYYVEGLNHNLFSVGQFCDADLEVAFRKSTCYIRDLKGNDLLTGSRGTDLFSISLQDAQLLPINLLMAKSNIAQSMVMDIVSISFKLLHHQLAFKKAKEKSFHTKTTPSSKRRVTILQHGLCGPMRVQSINGRNRTIATACFTQETVLFVIPDMRNEEKTPYHIINARKPSVKFFHIFGSLCYIIRDGENLDKMKEKDHVFLDPGPQCSTMVLEQDSLSPGPQSQENVPQIAETVTTSKSWISSYNRCSVNYSMELLVVSKSSAISHSSIEHSFNTSNSNAPRPTVIALLRTFIK
ncbi:hypothetical protein Tco_1291786 [Tanacetum coccineum]